MDREQLKNLLSRLHAELEGTDKVDPETLELVRDLDEEIDRLVESGGGADENLVDRAKAAETRFAVDHPVAERFLREIVDALAKVGI